MKVKHDWSYPNKRISKILNSQDFVHPLNVTLLYQFINQNNHIKHRVFTRLTNKQQKAITKAIKISRQLGLMSSKHYD